MVNFDSARKDMKTLGSMVGNGLAVIGGFGLGLTASLGAGADAVGSVMDNIGIESVALQEAVFVIGVVMIALISWTIFGKMKNKFIKIIALFFAVASTTSATIRLIVDLIKIFNGEFFEEVGS